MRDLYGDLVWCAPVDDCLDSVLEPGQRFDKGGEFECGNKDDGTGCMVNDVLNGILSKGIIQGDTVG